MDVETSIEKEGVVFPGLHETLITKDIEDVSQIKRALFTTENTQKQVKDYDESIQCFMFMNFGIDIVVETVGKKVTCISCLEMFGRIDIHWKKAKNVLRLLKLTNFGLPIKSIK